MALTRFTLGFHILLERRWEWLTLMPKETPLSQKSHFAMMRCTSLFKNPLNEQPYYNNRRPARLQDDFLLFFTCKIRCVPVAKRREIDYNI